MEREAINVPVVSGGLSHFQRGRLTRHRGDRTRSDFSGPCVWYSNSKKEHNKRKEKESFSVAASPTRWGGRDNSCEGGDNISLMRLMGKKQSHRVGRGKKKKQTSGIKVLSGEKTYTSNIPLSCGRIFFFSRTSWKLFNSLRSVWTPPTVSENGRRAGLQMTFANCPRNQIQPDRCLAFIINISDSQEA